MTELTEIQNIPHTAYHRMSSKFAVKIFDSRGDKAENVGKAGKLVRMKLRGTVWSKVKL